VSSLGLKVSASGASRRRAEQAAAQLLLNALKEAQQGIL
jgi:dsRNA-specific ribonuclease